MIEYAFARASLATVVDFEGVIRTCKDDEARFQGARQVSNYVLYSEDITAGGDWFTVGNTVITSPTTVELGSGSCIIRSQLSRQTVNTLGTTYVGSVILSVPSGTADITLSVNRIYGGDYEYSSIAIVVTDVPTRFSIAHTYVQNHTTISVSITGSDIPVLTCTKWLFEEVTGQSNQNPSEYVSNGLGEEHGCGVDGVKYFPYKNGNTVDGNGIVTEAKGSAIQGIAYLNEAIAENLVPNSTDMTQLTINHSGTVTLDGTIRGNAAYQYTDGQVGYAGVYLIFGNASIADGATILATFWARDATNDIIVIQTYGGHAPSTSHFTVELNIKTGEVVIIKLTGEEPVITVEAHADASFITVSMVRPAGGTNYNIWLCAYQPGVEPTNVATFAMGQVEIAPGPTSYIPTSGVALTRAADNLSYTGVDVHGDFVAGCDVTPFRGE